MKTKTISVNVPEQSDLPEGVTQFRLWQKDVKMFCGYFDDVDSINPASILPEGNYILYAYTPTEKEYVWRDECFELVARCPNCKEEIDPDTCWCGDYIKNHYYENHAAIPMGCTCGHLK